MGLFSAFRLASAYEKRLKAYGIDPNILPAELNGRICSFAKNQQERISQYTPEMRNSMYMEAALVNAADLVAFCLLGPTDYRVAGGNTEVLKESIKDAAEAWTSEVASSRSDTLTIKALNDAGLLDDEFIELFKSLI